MPSVITPCGGGGGGGIQFDTSPQTGSFLVTTTSGTTTFAAASLVLQAPAVDIGSGAVVYDATGAESVTLTAGRVDAVAQSEASLTANAGDVAIAALGSATSLLLLTAQGTGEGPIRHEMYGYQTVELGNKPGHIFGGNSNSGVGTRFDFKDEQTGAVLLRIDVAADGTATFHLPVGAAWVADLPVP